MSILIRGASLPKSCNKCKLDLRTDICQAFCEWNAEHPYSIRATDRLPDCPLSEVPEPCEDAVSRNLVLSEVKSGMIRTIEGEDWKRVSENVRDIKAMPSVTPNVPDTNVGKMECEDAVNREILLKFFDDWMSVLDENCHNQSVSDLKIIKRDSANLPPVTPKQRTGYWIPVGMAEAVGGESAQWGSAIAYHKCSECDEQALCEFGQEVLSKWCPHCGAKMEGVSE